MNDMLRLVLALFAAANLSSAPVGYQWQASGQLPKVTSTVESATGGMQEKPIISPLQSPLPTPILPPEAIIAE